MLLVCATNLLTCLGVCLSSFHHGAAVTSSIVFKVICFAHVVSYMMFIVEWEGVHVHGVSPD